MKKFSIVLAIMVMVMFLSGVVYADEPWLPMMDKLDEIHEIVLDTNDKVTPMPCEGAPVAKTGQTISYESGDDGNLQIGVAPPVPRFTDNLDGTVTDNLTSLIWTKDANLYGSVNWSPALSACNSCSVGNYTDWRLPNIKELQSLIDYTEYKPALTNGHPFINVLNGYHYWTSTTPNTEAQADHGNDIVFTSEFTFGKMGVGAKGHFWYVWCVRGGN